MSEFMPKSITLGDGSEVLLRSPALDEASDLIAYLDAVRRESDGIMFCPEDDLLSEEAERQWIGSHLGHDNAILIGAYVEGEIVALSGMQPNNFVRQGHSAGVGISIRDRWCGRGLGTLLMRELVGWARTRPELEQLTLNVFASNPRAEAVYRKVGFQEDGRLPRRAKVKGRCVDIVEMSLWLEDVGVTS